MLLTHLNTRARGKNVIRVLGKKKLGGGQKPFEDSQELAIKAPQEYFRVGRKK